MLIQNSLKCNDQYGADGSNRKKDSTSVPYKEEHGAHLGSGVESQVISEPGPISVKSPKIKKLSINLDLTKVSEQEIDEIFRRVKNYKQEIDTLMEIDFEFRGGRTSKDNLVKQLRALDAKSDGCTAADIAELFLPGSKGSNEEEANTRTANNYISRGKIMRDGGYLDIAVWKDD